MTSPDVFHLMRNLLSMQTTARIEELDMMWGDMVNGVNANLACLAGWYRSNKVLLNLIKIKALIFSKSVTQHQDGTC